MTNNDEGKMNTENNNSLLKYSGGTSYTSRSSAESQSEGTLETSTAGEPPVQYESRKARRMSETSMMQQVPVPPANPTIAPAPEVPTLTVAPVSTRRAAKSAVQMSHAPKEYWGLTAIIFSFVALLVAQVIAAIILIGYLFFNPELLKQTQEGGAAGITEFMAGTPWLLLTGNLLMYFSWLGCIWWVTRYRSGVQRGKKFWAAFKDNFRLNNFKKRDIFYGAGIAGVMLGVQHLALTGLPELFPSLKPEIEAANNTVVFQEMDDLWFYLIGFGMAGLIGPICEELFFRGFLLRGFSNHYSYKNSGRNMDILEEGLEQQALGLKSMLISYRSFTHKYRYVLATIVTSILFGLVHFQGSLITCAMTGLLGLVFAIVTLKLNRLYPAIFGHIFHNSLVFVILAMSR